MAGLKKYNVKDGRYDTVLLLSDEHAKELGLTDKDLAESKPKKATESGRRTAKKASTKKAAAPANKAREADENKDA